MSENSYRESHKYAGKGTEYEKYFQEQRWEKFVWSREKEILLMILGKYFSRKDIHLLDFACGTGRITNFLEEHVKTSTGIDVSNSMLEIAKMKTTRTEIIEGDITKENLLIGRKFNLITAFRFFLNAELDLRAIAVRKLGELLAEDGYLVFNNHQSYGSPWIKWLCMRHRQKNWTGTFNVMSIEEMKRLVEGVGMEIIEIYPIGFFHPPKIPISYRLNRVIDNIIYRFKFLNRFSESPVVVCRWLKSRSN